MRTDALVQGVRPGAFGRLLRSRRAVVAGFLLTAAVVIVVGGLSSPAGVTRAGAVTSGGDAGDIALHRATVARLSSGESYYLVVGDELRRQGYPSASVFNWRTPLLFSAVALNPAAARYVLIGLGVLLLVATIRQLGSEPAMVVIGGAVAQAGALPITLVPGSVVLHEVWTGALIGCSVCLYLRRRWIPAALIGALALFVRELAAPYCVVAVLLALRDRRWKEISVWSAAGAAYLAYFAFHALQVKAHQVPGDLSHLEPWVQWGGLRFILSTLQWNGWLSVAPLWVAALVLVVLLAGILDPRTEPHLRFGVLAYLLFFAVVGHSFNSYWGVIPLFIYPLLFARALGALASVSNVS